jgi:hypothetical protein
MAVVRTRREPACLFICGAAARRTPPRWAALVSTAASLGVYSDE